ncbi:MAG: sigma-70 family RNA polymerase sigma factor [Pirellulales bacterium]|nr:sigma-70 family RNA polymerase sigma factor [Pirellulales bacterium]
MNDDEQQALVERLKQGDGEALGQYLAAKGPQLLGYIVRQMGPGLRSRIEPEDLAQEVSAEAVRSLPAMELGDRDPFGWLCQIAQRRIVDAHRRLFGAQKRSAAREVSIDNRTDDSNRGGFINLLVASMTTASQAFSRGQREVKLLAALDELPEEQREALRLRYVEGLPSKEIAEKLGKSDGAVRVMLSRSLTKLQGILGPMLEK